MSGLLKGLFVTLAWCAFACQPVYAKSAHLNTKQLKKLLVGQTIFGEKVRTKAKWRAFFAKNGYAYFQYSGNRKEKPKYRIRKKMVCFTYSNRKKEICRRIKKKGKTSYLWMTSGTGNVSSHITKIRRGNILLTTKPMKEKHLNTKELKKLLVGKTIVGKSLDEKSEWQAFFAKDSYAYFRYSGKRREKPIYKISQNQICFIYTRRDKPICRKIKEKKSGYGWINSGTGKFLSNIAKTSLGNRLSVRDKKKVKNKNRPVTVKKPADRQIKINHNHNINGAIRIAKFSPNRKQIVSVHEGNILKLWDAKSGNMIVARKLQHQTKYITFSPDGKLLVTAECMSKNNRSECKGVMLYLRDAINGKLLHRMEENAHTLIFTADSMNILSGNGKVLHLWDAKTGKLVRTLKGHRSNVSSIAISNDKYFIASGANKQILLWSGKDWKLVRKLKIPSTANAIAFSPNGKLIAASDLTGNVYVLNPMTGKMVRSFNFSKKQKAPLNALLFLDNDKLLIQDDQGKLTAVNLSVEGDIRNFSKKVKTFDISTYNHVIVALTGEKTPAIIDLETRKVVLEFKSQKVLEPIIISAAAFIPDGSKFLTLTSTGDCEECDGGYCGKCDPKLAIWDTNLISILQTIDLPPSASEAGKLAVSHDGKILVSYGGNSFGATIVNIENNSVTGQLGIEDYTRISQVQFSQESDRIATVSQHYENSQNFIINAWNIKSLPGESFFEVSETNIITSMLFSPKGRMLAITLKTGELKIVNLSNGNEIAKFKQAKHTGSVHFSSNSCYVYIKSKSAKIVYFDISENQFCDSKERKIFTAVKHHFSIQVEGGSANIRSNANDNLVEIIQYENGEWLAHSSEGFFNASPEGANSLNVIQENNVFPISRVYQALYRPDLVREKLAGDPNGKVKVAAAKLNLDKILESGMAPQVSFLSPENGEESENEEILAEISITEQNGGIGRIEWRVNGVTLGVQERGLGRIDKGPLNLEKTQFIRKALQLEPGKNIIEVVVYNRANLIASEPARIKVNRSGARSETPPNLWVLAVGVNDYWDSRLKLNYAVSDAKAISSALHTAGKGLYQNIYIKNILNGDATIAGLEKAFAELGEQVRSRDVFVFYLAGHGKTVDGKYYFIPQDFRYQNPQSIVKDGVGPNRWQKWLAKIPARKSILLYDTCESGSLTGLRIASRGMERVVALEKLTRAMGRTVLSAATDDAPALEGYNGHGVFTWALLDALARGDVNGNKLVEVTELASYVDTQVPEISFRAFGQRQVPQMNLQGSNFPLVRQTVTVAPDNVGKVVIPRKPTHIVLRPADVFAEIGSNVVVKKLKPGTTVSLVRTKDGWVLVAKEGKKIGFITKEALAQIQ